MARGHGPEPKHLHASSPWAAHTLWAVSTPLTEGGQYICSPASHQATQCQFTFILLSRQLSDHGQVAECHRSDVKDTLRNAAEAGALRWHFPSPHALSISHTRNVPISAKTSQPSGLPPRTKVHTRFILVKPNYSSSSGVSISPRKTCLGLTQMLSSLPAKIPFNMVALLLSHPQPSQTKSEALKGSPPSKHQLNLDTVLFSRASASTQPHSIPFQPKLIHGHIMTNHHFITVTAPSRSILKHC